MECFPLPRSSSSSHVAISVLAEKAQQTDNSAKMAQANSFEASSSQIQVEHDKKRRQFVIRLNGLQLPFQAQLLSSAHDSEASQKLVFSSGVLNNKPNQLPSQAYFFLKSKGSHDRAVLLYEYVGKKTVDLQHTEVPDAYRGRGIAKHLAKAAMDFVVEEDLKAHLTCWYIQKYVKENPQPQYFEHIHQ